MDTQVFANAEYQAGVCYYHFDGTGWNYLSTSLRKIKALRI